MRRFRPLWVRTGGLAPGTACVPQCLMMKLPSRPPRDKAVFRCGARPPLSLAPALRRHSRD
eukprot:15354957-Alexandrium_andersonii.AAC.1